MIQAIGALCVAALGGLTIIAYRHPKKYQKLYLVPHYYYFRVYVDYGRI